ncbi:MAG: AcrR family transcriptional regulator [Myxococcota bacterium]|jgi:AcrR family transcriptional regulator
MPKRPTATTASPTPRRTQAERSGATKGRLIDATIACLIAHGYHGTTTLAVCKRAGVSHGSLLHHYGTRDRLLGAALEVVYERLRIPVVDAIAQLPQGAERVDALVELMWSAFGAPEFKAVIELWLAAANQPSVGWAVWPEAQAFDNAIQPLAEHLFPEVAARVPDFPLYISLLFQTMQGMGLANATLPQRDDDLTAVRVRALLKRLLREAFAPISS